MPYTINSGPGGIETQHTWQVNLLTMGTLGVPTKNDRINGYIKLNDIPGLRALPDAPLASTPNRGRRGSTPLPSQPKTKTIQYLGVVRGRTLETVRRKSAQAIAAFRDRNTEGVMAITPVDGGPAWFYYARPVACEVTDTQKYGNDAVNKWERDFTLQLELYDPRIYALLPGSKANGQGSAVLYNQGLTDTDPYFTLPLFAGGDLELQNSANNRVLRFESLPAGALTVDFRQRQLLQGGVDRTGYMDPDCDWWDESVQGLLPGNNTVAVYGDAGVTPTWSCSWYPAVEG